MLPVLHILCLNTHTCKVCIKIKYYDDLYGCRERVKQSEILWNFPPEFFTDFILLFFLKNCSEICSHMKQFLILAT